MARLDTLKRIIQVKEYKKSEAEIELQKAWRVLKTEQSQLALLEKHLADNTAALDKKKNSRNINGYELTLYYDYIETLYKKIDAQTKVVAEKTLEMEKKQTELVEAYREVKTVEVLKDRVVSDESKKMERQTQREMDFAYLSRLPRN
ncbi:MAG: flagellar export protein FliJ [Nitrospirae bacterium]|nr:flagellar export protein FliJ [Nitrospirota bacterium]MBF0534927.1 flagellar export protein FliJ [Nitrospirota bacterium]MBF0617222.1 flagellar export protein FliJ [Nitrospirota bacterium]